ncbi:MAG: RnfABCDGE type electron transport complex subunit D [Deltaproteobacteria bacterium]|nr:RnfABCDGE type electron transport complex subunit D [Deltaproteobacteria bacterium]
MDEKIQNKPQEKSKETTQPTIDRLVVSSSPHFSTGDSVPKIMHAVILALLPASAASIYFFGLNALLLGLTCVIACMLTEYAIQKIRRKPITVWDGSAIITGILLALTLPPAFPLYAAALGSIVAIGLGKQIFGGLGYNIFNPALLGRAFLQATYPVMITTWSEPLTKAAKHGIDAVSAATPLALMKFVEPKVMTPHLDLFFGNVAGSIGETSAFAIILGGLYLRYKGYINWKMPLGYLGSIAFFGWLFYLANPQKYPDPLFHILAGGAMLGAWFMVTDMVTSPTTSVGQWIFVVVAGFLVVIIRLLGGLPEGVMYSILLMNAITPLINRHTKPKVFGEGNQS